VTALVCLAACRSAPTAAPVAPAGLEQGRRPPVECEKVRPVPPLHGPVDPALSAYVGRLPLIGLFPTLSCWPGLEASAAAACPRVPGDFAVFPDGDLVFEGAACGFPSVTLSHQLTPEILGAVRARVAGCGSLEKDRYACYDTPHEWLTCETAAGVVELVQRCPGNDPFNRFVDDLRSAVGLAAIIADPQTCARGRLSAGRDHVDLGELVWHTLRTERHRACTGQRQ
jgi:hypothetical protein